MKKLLISAILFISVNTNAKWVELYTDEEFSAYISAPKTLITNQTQEYAETWIKYIVHTDLTKDGMTIGDHRIVNYRLKCNSNEIGISAAYDYHKNEVINSFTPSHTDYSKAIPDTKGEMILDIICQTLFN